MENTGRIKKHILPEIRDILYRSSSSEEELLQELHITAKINKAHILMLAEQNIISRSRAQRIVDAVLRMEDDCYRDVLDSPMFRGLYMAYEEGLIKRIGLDDAGYLQFGRSRNDLKVCVLKIQLRTPLMLLLERMHELIELLIEKAREYRDCILPVYTHYQPAVPISYGHYLTGFAFSILRSAEQIQNLLETDLSICPLGACAVGGTTLPIHPGRTAELLGFSAPLNNSLETVASRDFVLRLLAEMSILETAVSRICEDLLLWTSSDLRFLLLPDELVGGSSIMPNKRNAFMLENIRGRCSSASGAFSSALTAMHGEPFTNSIATGTEGVRYVWEPLRTCTDTLFLLICNIRGAEPNREAMLTRALDGYTLATEQANFIAMNTTHSFREAHSIIGGMITDAENGGKPFSESFRAFLMDELGEDAAAAATEKLLVLDGSYLDIANYGGGPGLRSMLHQRNLLLDGWKDLCYRLDTVKKRYQTADETLSRTVETFLKGGEDE